MTDKELKKLSRAELLQMLLDLVEENESLRQELTQARGQLADRIILIENSGSIAEAALKLNGVFELAQQAADSYLENIRQLTEEPEAMAQKLLREAQEKADGILADAEQRAAKSRAAADEYWLLMRSKVRNMLE